MKRISTYLLMMLAGLLVGANGAMAYPLDGYKETGIRRVEGARLANLALAIGGFQPPHSLQWKSLKKGDEYFSHLKKEFMIDHNNDYE